MCLEALMAKVNARSAAKGRARSKVRPESGNWITRIPDGWVKLITAEGGPENRLRPRRKVECLPQAWGILAPQSPVVNFPDRGLL